MNQVKFIVAVFIALVIAAGAPPVQAEPAGLVVNARIHTLDAESSVAEALAWSTDGRIVALGDSAELAERFSQLEPVDLDGRTVIPGLIDAHGHIMGLGLARLQADLVEAASVAEVIDRLREHAKRLPPEAWLTGRGWDQTRWPGQQFPTAADLDEAFPERPVYLVRIDGHAAWANTAALEHSERDLAGDWQPQGGHIHRDDEGRPTGILIDTAMRTVSERIPDPSEAELERALDLALEEFARLGLTGVHEAGTSLDALRRYVHRAAAGRLPVRIHALADGDGELLESLCRLGTVHGQRVVARAVKLYADGALGSRGAALLEDYSDDPGNRGLLFESDEDLYDQVDRAMGCGLQVGIHAIGDAANRQVIDALAQGMDSHPENPGRHRVEHLQIVHPDDLPRLAEHGIIASMQPIHATSDMRWAEDRLGADRLGGAYAWQRVLDAGARLALGSDFPVEPVNPMLGIYAAVTRQDLDGHPPDGWLPDQRLSVREAVAGFTRDAAYAGFAEDRVGTLETGKQADFVVLDRDIMEIEADAIPEITVLTTVLDGEPVYRHETSPL